MTDWFIGQRVQCIHKGGWFDALTGEPGRLREPSLGDIVVISAIVPWAFRLDPGAPPDTVGLEFVEYPGDDYCSYAFRPLVDAETDISLFEQMLDPTAPKIKELV
jgi:hypothetical protein